MPTNPKPRSQKKLEGTYRKTRDMPVAVPGERVEWCDVTRPRWLDGVEARRMFDELGEYLTGIGVLTRGDLPALGLLANVHAEIREVRAEGHRTPAALMTTFRQMLGEFGLTPATRGRLNPVTARNATTDSFDALKAG